MTLQPLQPEDLMDLAEALRRAGYDIGTQQHVAAQDLVIALAAHGRLPADPREWRGLLAPVFCSSPAEQDEFRQHFEQWLARRPALARQAAAFEADSIPSAARRRWFRRPRLLAAIGALLLLAIVTIYFSTNTTFTLKGKITDGKTKQPIAGAKIHFNASPQPVLADDNGEFSISYQAKKLDVLRRRVRMSLTVEHPGYRPITHLHNGDPPQFLDIPLFEPVKLGQRAGESVRAGTPSGDAAPSPTPAPLATGWRDSKRVRAVIASLSLWLFALWWLWRRYRRRMILEKLQSAGHPHLDRIVVRGAPERLFQGPAIRRAIQELRRHRRTQSNELDVPGAVRATIRRAGMFAPVYGTRRTLPEYLLLVERAGPHDAQARLAAEICQRLEIGGVFVDSYEFQHDPRTCRRPELASPTLTLHDLAARHPDHCLLIFGDGAGLISPVTGEPGRWIESFAQWEHRALLTPEPPGHWRDREESLAENEFILLPATEDGLASLSEAIQTGIAPKPNGDARPALFPASIAERPQHWIERQTPRPAVLDRLCGELRAYLGEDGWQWLCAAAVYPAVSWEIALYLGRELLGDRADFEARLMRLVRLPWFRYGVMPDWLRSRLIESFAAGAPGQEDRVRQAIEAMLLGALESPPERLKDGIHLEIACAEEEAKPGLFKRRRRLGDLLQSEPDDSPLRDYVPFVFSPGANRRNWRSACPACCVASSTRTASRSSAFARSPAWRWPSWFQPLSGSAAACGRRSRPGRRALSRTSR